MENHEKMKMLMIVCRDSLEDEVLDLLKLSGISCGYSIISQVTGCGEAGTVDGLGYFTGLGFNTMILVVIEQKDFDRVVEAIRSFHLRLMQTQEGRSIPLKVFAQACEIVV
jgi:nitrogen regulatory protein PII